MHGACSYGAEQGTGPLREAIANTFYSNTCITPSEIFVSDGSKCDIGRLQMMFGSKATVAVQVRRKPPGPCPPSGDPTPSNLGPPSTQAVFISS